MKKRIYMFVLLFISLLTSCTTGGGTVTPNKKTYTVSFDSNGGTEVTNQIIEEGNLAVEPKDPTKENYEFICWTYNNEKFDFKTPISNDITLLAKWEQKGTHAHIYNEEVVEPTCDNLGYTIYTCECGDTYKDNYVNNLDHDLVFFDKVEPTCTEIGCEAYVECTRCSYTTYKELEALDHDLVSHEGKTPTDVEIGWEEYVTCTRCDYTTYEELPAEGIKIYEKDGKMLLNFGSYPQTHINESTLIKELNKLTNVNSRGYYEYNGNEYAKVRTKPYNYSSARYVYNTGTPVEKGVIEWFKVEPIVWRVLSVENNLYHLISENILDHSLYYNSISDRVIDNLTIYSNNYMYSDIRKFLNNYFLNSAFTPKQQESILISEVNNSSSTTSSLSNPYVCENSFDKIYLLSYRDVLNIEFGFSLSFDERDNDRKAIVTDYAKAMGVWWSTESNNYNLGYWWLRSPYNTDYRFVGVVSYDGKVDDSVFAYYDEGYGVRPAIVIKVD